MKPGEGIFTPGFLPSCRRIQHLDVWGLSAHLPCLTSEARVPISVGVHADAGGAGVDGPRLSPHAVLGADGRDRREVNPCPDATSGDKGQVPSSRCPHTHGAVGEGVAVGVGDDLEEDVHVVQDGGDGGIPAVLLGELQGEGAGAASGPPRDEGRDRAAPGKVLKEGSGRERGNWRCCRVFFPIGSNHSTQEVALVCNFCPSFTQIFTTCGPRDGGHHLQHLLSHPGDLWVVPLPSQPTPTFGWVEPMEIPNLDVDVPIVGLPCWPSTRRWPG